MMLGKVSLKVLKFRWFVAVLFILPLLAGTVGTAAAKSNADSGGAVYTMTNAANNAIQVYQRNSDGTLTPGGSYSTGGQGTGAELGSQGAIALSADGRWLFAVNAGSNEISSFAVQDGQLTLADKVSSGGPDPISLTVNRNVLYVLDAGGSGSITGFWVSSDGRLSPIDDSTRPLSNQGSGAAPSPEQISFSPNGNLLVVTEKGSGLIDTYNVKRGVASDPQTHASSGPAPYGFGFIKNNVLVVSEAAQSGTSSYRVNRGQFRVISASVPDNQGAACWLTVSHSSQFVYVANAGTGNISGYRAQRNGKLELLKADGITGVTGPGTHPFDMGLSLGDQFLYVLNVGTHTISTFAVGSDGSLSFVNNVAAPVAASGLVVR